MTLFREKLWPAPWLFIATALVIPATLLVLAPISMPAGIVTAIVLYAGCVASLLSAAAVIEVSDRQLRAGKASIDAALIGNASAHSGADATAERGTRLDARAWLLIRGWVHPVVKLELNDPDDPTPYWLLSTRRPEELLTALKQAQQAS